MGKLKDSFTAVATSLTPVSRRDDAQNFTRMLRNMSFEARFFSRAGVWLDEGEATDKAMYLNEVKSQLEKTGFDMTQWDSLAEAVVAASELATTGAMQTALQEDSASKALTSLASQKDVIAQAVAAADEKLAPLREKIVNAQQTAYLMHRPMM